MQLSISDIEFTLILSNIMTELENDEYISEKSLKEFKKYICQTKEYKDYVLYSIDIIERMVSKYLLTKIHSDTVSIYEDFNNKIKLCYKEIEEADINIYFTMFKYYYENNNGENLIDNQVIELEGIINKFPNIRNVFLDIERKSLLLKLYLTDFKQYKTKISVLSSDIKNLLSIRDNIPLLKY